MKIRVRRGEGLLQYIIEIGSHTPDYRCPQDTHVSMEHGHHGDSYNFTRHLHFIGNLTLEERICLTQIADKCPVHKTLFS